MNLEIDSDSFHGIYKMKGIFREGNYEMLCKF